MCCRWQENMCLVTFIALYSSVCKNSLKPSEKKVCFLPRLLLQSCCTRSKPSLSLTAFFSPCPRRLPQRPPAPSYELPSLNATSFFELSAASVSSHAASRAPNPKGVSGIAGCGSYPPASRPALGVRAGGGVGGLSPHFPCSRLSALHRRDAPRRRLCRPSPARPGAPRRGIDFHLSRQELLSVHGEGAARAGAPNSNSKLLSGSRSLRGLLP